MQLTENNTRKTTCGNAEYNLRKTAWNCHKHMGMKKTTFYSQPYIVELSVVDREEYEQLLFQDDTLIKLNRACKQRLQEPSRREKAASLRQIGLLLGWICFQTVWVWLNSLNYYVLNYTLVLLFKYKTFVYVSCIQRFVFRVLFSVSWILQIVFRVFFSVSWIPWVVCRRSSSLPKNGDFKIQQKFVFTLLGLNQNSVLFTPLKWPLDQTLKVSGPLLKNCRRR